MQLRSICIYAESDALSNNDACAGLRRARVPTRQQGCPVGRPVADIIKQMGDLLKRLLAGY